MCVCVILLLNKKANCITVKLPVNKLIQAYGSVNRHRLGYAYTVNLYTVSGIKVLADFLKNFYQ